MSRNNKRHFIFLEQMPLTIKKHYINELKKYFFDELSYHKHSDCDMHMIQGCFIAQLTIFAAKIHYPLKDEKDFYDLIQAGHTDYSTSDEFKNIILNNPENHKIYLWSLAKDLIATNFLYYDWFAIQEEIEPLGNDYADEWERIYNNTDYDNFPEKSLEFKRIFHSETTKRWYKSSPFILNFIETVLAGNYDDIRDCFIWADAIEAYVEISLKDMVNSDAEDDEYEEMLKIFEDPDGDILQSGMVPLNALYFSGSPDGMRAIDYLGLLTKAYGLYNDASSLIQAELAIIKLSNPVSGIIELASMGISNVNRLAENSNIEKLQFKMAVVKAHKTIFRNAKNSITTFMQYIRLSCNEIESQKSNSQDIKRSFDLLCDLTDAYTYLQIQEENCQFAELEINLPLSIDRKRLKAITAKTELLPIRKYVESCYYSEDYEDEFFKNKLKAENSIEDLEKLKIIFDDLGYFTLTGLAKKFLNFK